MERSRANEFAPTNFVGPDSSGRAAEEAPVSEAPTTVIVSEEAQPTTPTSSALRWIISTVAVAMSLYHMYVAAFGPPEAIIFRGTHLLFALTLVFLLYPLRPGRVSASYVMLFVLFGAFMERSGTGQLFMDFSMSLTGHTAGGPGKVAIVSSALFGTVSGSAVANVMVDGPITIPLMKRTGFRPPFAAAVEAVASTGGQLMPPVMGAAAFVMAEFLAVPYAQVALWAAIPALLYYVALFFAVHFDAKRYKLGGVPKSQLPRFFAVMRVRGHL